MTVGGELPRLNRLMQRLGQCCFICCSS